MGGWGVMGSDQWSSDAVSLTSGGVFGRSGDEVEASSRLGSAPVRSQSSESPVAVTSNVSRVWLRSRGTPRLTPSSNSGNGEGGSEYGGEGGRGEIELWNEWKESPLDDRFEDCFLRSGGIGMLAAVFEGGMVLNVSCGGAVTVRPVLRDFGRVGVLKVSGSSKARSSRFPRLRSRSPKP